MSIHRVESVARRKALLDRGWSDREVGSDYEPLIPPVPCLTGLFVACWSEGERERTGASIPTDAYWPKGRLADGVPVLSFSFDLDLPELTGESLNLSLGVWGELPFPGSFSFRGAVGIPYLLGDAHGKEG